MKRKLTELGVLTATVALAIGSAVGQTTPPGGAAIARASLQDAQGRSVGDVTLTQYHGGVVLRGELTGLPPGWHAIHVHQNGACTPDFKAAGDHFNPGGTKHGLDEAEPHAGDLANIWADDQGSAKFELMTDRFSLGEAQTAAAGTADTAALAAAPNLFDEDGAALVVHAGPDDYATDPSGGSGDRIACGAIDQG